MSLLLIVKINHGENHKRRFCMQISVHYQGLENSPWMDQFITTRVSKLNRYLSPAATVQIHLKMDGLFYVTSLAIHNMNHNYAYSAQGENLYESFQLATDRAARALAEHKRMLKDRIHRKSSNFNNNRATA
jgi:ribosomal subunit interface protein